MKKIILCITILIILLSLSNSAENLVCYSSTKKESVTIYKYFYGVEGGTFIDYYPSHPFWNSETIYLRTKGWSGINIINKQETFTYFNEVRQ